MKEHNTDTYAHAAQHALAAPPRNTPSERQNDGPPAPWCAWLALLSPLGGVVLGIALSLASGQPLAGIYIAALATAVGGPLLAIASMKRGEPHRPVAWLGLLASLGPFVYLLIALMVHRAR